MNETYVESMVKCKTSVLLKTLQIVCIVLAALSFILLLGVIGLLVAVALGLAAYFLGTYAEVEYEYLYVDRELTVDKILARRRRKRMLKLELDKMEIMAPISSHSLDNFKHREFKKTLDYSSREKEQNPERRYALIFDGENKLIFEPNPEMVKAISNIAPRKVFTE